MLVHTSLPSILKTLISQLRPHITGLAIGGGTCSFGCSAIKRNGKCQKNESSGPVKFKRFAVVYFPFRLYDRRTQTPVEKFDSGSAVHRLSELDIRKQSVYERECNEMLATSRTGARHHNQSHVKGNMESEIKLSVY